MTQYLSVAFCTAIIFFTLSFAFVNLRYRATKKCVAQCYIIIIIITVVDVKMMMVVISVSAITAMMMWWIIIVIIFTITC